MLLIFLSAVLYAISFMIPQLWWTILLFTIPLHHTRLRFFDGFAWGIVAFSIHASGILYATMRMQNGPWIVRLIPSILIVLYLALHTGIWLIVLKKFKHYKRQKIVYCCINSLIHTLFFWYISYVCLWPIAPIQGYPLANPLLPLTKSALYLLIIRYAGMSGGLFILFLTSILITKIFNTYIKTIVTMLVILILHWHPSQEENTSEWTSTVMPVHIQFSSTKNPLVPLNAIQETIDANPDKKIFIFPESAFYCSDIFTQKKIPILHNSKGVCLIGSFSMHNNNRYNSLYFIENGTIKGIHHKQHTVPLTESIPPWGIIIPWIRHLHDHTTLITKAPKKHDYWSIEGRIIEPYICSELFCHRTPLHPLSENSTILLCCNDSWFTNWTSYGAQLMVADARLKASCWHIDILYIGYQYALFISQKGSLYPLS